MPFSPIVRVFQAAKERSLAIVVAGVDPRTLPDVPPAASWGNRFALRLTPATYSLATTPKFASLW